jgi:hypothetical protein
MPSVGRPAKTIPPVVVFKVGIPQGVAFSISYIEADRELPELVLAVPELPN